MTEEKKIDRLFVDKKDISLFNRFKQKDSPFVGSQNKDIFIAAMLVGYKEGTRLELRNKEGYVREEYLTKEDLAIINSIAVGEEDDLNILTDKEKVFSIAEQYAAGGIALLKAKVFGGEFGSYSKKLESQLLREYKKLQNALPAKPIAPEELDGLPLEELIKKDESDTIEFKSSFIWDYKEERPNKEIKKEAMIALSAFMNSEGGFLLIGIDDKKEILGLKKDLAQTHKSRNEFEDSITSAIKVYLGSINRRYMKVNFKNIDDKCIVVIRIKPASHPVYFKPKGQDSEFYVRLGNRSQKLDVSDATQYINEHWPHLR